MVKNHPLSLLTEAYRKVVTNIEFANIDNDKKIIMVTSSIAGEGKTTTVCNIASVMTEFSKKVLLIDLDLRKPSVHKFFNLSNRSGLVDLLMNKDELSKYINNVYPKLDVLTAGQIPSSTAEIINSKRLKDMLKEFSANYDYIFLDTPPIALVSDSLTISTFADAVILVVACGKTEIEIAKKSVDSLKKVNANIIGSILNRTQVSKHKNYYYRNDNGYDFD
jgi:capsular exopolysaccharide synthesis family protein